MTLNINEMRYFILWEPVYGEGFEVHSWWLDDEQADEWASKLKCEHPECQVVSTEETNLWTVEEAVH